MHYEAPVLEINELAQDESIALNADTSLGDVGDTSSASGSTWEDLLK